MSRGLNLDGRVAVVTGGGRGIGRATAINLARAGASVMVNYLSDAGAAQETVEVIKGEGGSAYVFKGDVSQLEAAAELVKNTIDVFGRIDILVCNAGVWKGAAVEELSGELWDVVLNVNLRGTWAACRAAVPEMKRARWGRIVIVSSTAGQRGEAGVSNYAASKGGQISFAKSLAVELAPFNINVNAVAPGWVETEMVRDVLDEQTLRNAIEREIPLGRFATPDDVALPITFLCSDWARHITGEVLGINGGSVL